MRNDDSGVSELLTEQEYQAKNMEIECQHATLTPNHFLMTNEFKISQRRGSEYIYDTATKEYYVHKSKTEIRLEALTNLILVPITHSIGACFNVLFKLYHVIEDLFKFTLHGFKDDTSFAFSSNSLKH